MKIGILTFHCAHNYGAVLQAYASQEYLKTLGFNSYIINYRPDYLTKGYYWFKKDRLLRKNLFKVVKELFLLSARKKRYIGFNGFIDDNYNLISYNKEKLEKLDVVFVGSDQIWNKDHCKGNYDPAFLGEDVKGPTKLISYAASLGKSILDTKDIPYLKKSWERFSAISVREYAAKSIIEEAVKKNVEVVLDPTLIVNKNTWVKLAKAPNIKSKYVLVYQAKNVPNTNKIAREVARSLNCQVIYLSAGMGNMKNSAASITSTPDEYLGWIQNAEFVVSSSFHGTVFSVIFNTAFLAIFDKTKSDDRVRSFLGNIGLHDRCISSMEEITTSKINWTSVEKELETLKIKSQDYLKRNLIAIDKPTNDGKI